MIDVSSLHTFGTLHHALSCISIGSVDELTSLNLQHPFYILGEGSNTIFVDDYQGQLIRNQIKGIAISDTADAFHLRVGAGENWHQLVVSCLAQGMGGFENLALIPGTVGAAPIQNIGAYGVEVERFIDSVEFIDLNTMQLQTLKKDECQFAYRDSVFKQQWAGRAFITHVNFILPKRYQVVIQYAELAALDNPSAQTIFERVCAVRRSKLPDPTIVGNAGSFFKNPVISAAQARELKKAFVDLPVYPINDTHCKVAAGWLIDHLGFKGQTRNQVQCNPQQALVLTNLGGADGEDVLAFASAIKKAVFETFAITLEHEVRLLGRQGLIAI